jgi:hypothetical protein
MQVPCSPSIDISPPPYITLKQQLFITPVQCQQTQKAVRTCRFKQYAIMKFPTAEKIPPIYIHCHKQTVYGNKYVDISTVRWWVWQFKQEQVGEASLCDTARLGRPVTATDKSHQERTEKLLVLKLEEIRWKSDYAQLLMKVKGIFIFFLFHLNISCPSFFILLEAQLFSPLSHNICHIQFD